MASVEYSQRDGYRTTQSQGHSSGFLTPPSPYEVRRDSVASSQSSYCHSFAASDYSASTDTSMPVTPTTCGRSPFAEDGFVDVMSYDMANNLQDSAFHGVPLATQNKAIMSGDSFADSPWIMVPTSLEAASSQTPFRTHNSVPVSTDFNSGFHTHTTLQSNLSGKFVSAAEPAWNSHQPLVWAGEDCVVNRAIDHMPPRVHDYDAESLRMYYPDFAVNHPNHVQTMSVSTIVPSDAMFDAQNDFVHVAQEEYGDGEAIEQPQSLPSSPQEVFFKREESVDVKEEPEIEEHKPTIRRSMYETSTGGKSVKRERRNGGASRKRVRESRKEKNYRVSLGDDKELVVYLQGLERNRSTGRFDKLPTHKTNKHYCKVVVANGRTCGRPFARPEHLKRHEYTHSGRRDFGCLLCDKLFNRNDNCTEHYWTHVQRPGRKPGRNNKMSLHEIEEIVGDPKIIEKLRRKWKAEVEKENASS